MIQSRGQQRWSHFVGKTGVVPNSPNWPYSRLVGLLWSSPIPRTLSGAPPEVKRAQRAVLAAQKQGHVRINAAWAKRKFRLDASLTTIQPKVFKDAGLKYTLRARKPAVPWLEGRAPSLRRTGDSSFVH